MTDWRSETHAIVALWSTEVLVAIRRHRASFEAIETGSDEEFEAWWSGGSAAGVHSAVALLDPVARRPTARPWIALDAALRTRARYTNYVAAVSAIEIAAR